MNILYMHTHDTGRFIEPYGHAIPTPNLMNLAEEGTLFRNAYCTGPTCSPSRAGLLTGMAPHSCGMFGLAHRGFGLNDYSEHLVQFLNNHNFETVLCGVQHESHNVDLIEYNKILTISNSDVKDNVEWDIVNANRVSDYIKQKKDKPFFLSFGMHSTHRPFPISNINSDYVMPPFPLADTAENRKDMSEYIESAKIADNCVGIILDALKESGTEDDTFVFFTTDHGIAFPKMKCNLYDTGIGVSLIIKFPGNKQKGKSTNALVSHVDIFPTICDILNIEKPLRLQGTSMLPLLLGETDTIRDEVFSEVTFHASYEPMRCIRTDRYKLIKFYDDHNKIVPSNMDDGYSKEFLIQHGYLNSTRAHDLLFDLYLDPLERINLAEDDSYNEVYADLSQRLEQWMKKTDDPLLSGKVEKPEGAIINKLSSISPSSKDYE